MTKIRGFFIGKSSRPPGRGGAVANSPTGGTVIQSATRASRRCSARTRANPPADQSAAVEDDLAERLVRREELVGAFGFSERNEVLDDGCHRARLEEWSHFGREGIGGGSLFLVGTGPKHGADD